MRRNDYIGILNNSMDSGFIYYDLLLDDPGISPGSKSGEAFRSLGKAARHYFESTHFIDDANRIKSRGQDLINLGRQERIKEINMLIANYNLNSRDAEKFTHAYDKGEFIDLFNDLTGNYEMAVHTKKAVEKMINSRQMAKEDYQNGDKTKKGWENIGLADNQFLGYNFMIIFNKKLTREANGNGFGKRFAELIKTYGLEEAINQFVNQIVEDSLDTLLNPEELAKYYPKDTKVPLELAELYKQLQANEQLKQKFSARLGDIFNLSGLKKSIEEEMKARQGKNLTQAQISKKAKSIKFKTTSKVGKATMRGNLEEIIQAAVNEAQSKHKNINGKTVQTELSQFMTDLATIVEDKFTGTQADLTIPDFSQFTKDIQVGDERSKAREAIMNWYNSIPNEKNQHNFVIFSSVKSSNLSKNVESHGGFSGTSFNYVNALDMLKQINSNKAQAFLAKLLNSMDDAIMGDKREETIQELRVALSTYIAQFLFDDFELIGKSDNRAIHVFQLDNITVPLSTFLIGAGNALLKMGDTSDYFKFDIHLENGIDFPAKSRTYYPMGGKRSGYFFMYHDKLNSNGRPDQGALPMKGAEAEDNLDYAWNIQRSAAQKDFELSIHFYKNFIDEVVSHIKG